jgi:hypothetical protein
MLMVGQVQDGRIARNGPPSGRDNTCRSPSVVMDSVLYDQPRVSGRSLSGHLRPLRTYTPDLTVPKLLHRGYLFLPLSAACRYELDEVLDVCIFELD